ncbi:tetratricopeptide repeat protein [Mangrovibacterium diazotrophicum]|uniref:Uncharacterized protein n=1 Tax=Mangrovibacterium diazotrophicum TaxID=1261403 RepID=A0A419VYQ7_9BACT|nr:hypothetical protein [Mangrovibacterium diazotrophicum]RKD88352.1 hypothetical protein BC643_3501 [Mangrovibacterium diazotrophicum]
MKTRYQILLLVLCFGLLPACRSNVNGQTPDAGVICKRALALPVDQGISLMERAMGRYAGADVEKMDKFQLNFTMAYLYQKQAAQLPGTKMEALERSKQYYSAALEVDPGNVAVLTNLVFVNQAMDNKEMAQELLSQLIKVDSANKAKYYARKGDLSAAVEKYDEAIGFYKRAFFGSTGNEALAWKIFDVCTRFTDKQHAWQVLNAFSNQLFEKGFYDLARTGFLNTLDLALTLGENEQATEACVRWAEALSFKPNVSENYAKDLPEPNVWTSTCNQEIQRLLTKAASTGEMGWWTSDVYRSHIVATLLYRMEATELIAGNVSIAVKLLEMGLQIAPEFYVYDHPKLKNYYPIKMDIAVELSRLYNRYPEMDLDNSKYDEMIRRLFNEKSAHYLQNNLEAIQKSHTMLGLIFADRGIWTSDWYAGNAVFQLKSAIRFQKQIESANPEKFKPIPAIYQLLAEGYAKTNQPDLVPNTLLEAAAGYLDLDNLSMADSLIKKAGSSGNHSPKLTEKLGELNLITKMRLDIRNDTYNFKSSDVEQLEKTIAGSKVFTMPVAAGDQSFLNRQKFKILADLGARCSENNPNYQYPSFEIKALNYISDEKALGNFQDISRLNQIEGKFQSNLDRGSSVQINQVKSLSEPKEESRTWQLNTGSYQGQVEVNPDLFIASQVYEDLKSENAAEQLDDVKQIQIRQGDVIIPKKLQENEQIDPQRLQQLNGVKNVRISNELQQK